MTSVSLRGQRAYGQGGIEKQGAGNQTAAGDPPQSRKQIEAPLAWHYFSAHAAWVVGAKKKIPKKNPNKGSLPEHGRCMALANF